MRVPSDPQIERPELPLAVTVTLIGEDGNAFAILGRVDAAMRSAGVEPGVRDLFMEEAMAGDYDHLVQTVQEWVEVS